MNLSLEQSSLLKIVQNAQRALSSKSTLPILSGIYLEATKEVGLFAYSTDLEIAIKNNTKASVKKEGRVVVFGNLLVDLIKNLEEGRVDLIFDDKENKLIIKSSGAQFQINTFPTEEYPSFPEIEKTLTIKTKNDNFLKALRQVAISISRDESRPTLTGLLFNSEKEKIKIVATDSYRLSQREIKNPKNNPEESLIIPHRAVGEIIKTLPKEGDVEISVSDKQISLKSGDLLFISRLMGGKYPNFEQLFPKQHEISVVIERESFLRAIKRISLVSPNTPIFLKIKDNTLTLAGKSADLGSGQEEISINNTDSKEIEVAFNSKYLIDGLSVLEDKEIKMQLVNSLQPGLIRGTQTEDYLYLIMPVRLN
jgi:DNA polymerase-3 subunit beta